MSHSEFLIYCPIDARYAEGISGVVYLHLVAIQVSMKAVVAIIPDYDSSRVNGLRASAVQLDPVVSPCDYQKVGFD